MTGPKDDVSAGVHTRAGVTRPVPVSEWLTSPALVAWRERVEPPIVTFRCGRGRRRCERLAFIFDTEHEIGAVVVFHLSVAPQPASVPENIAGDPRLEAHLVERFKYTPGAARAYSHGLPDRDGTVVALERDDLWRNVVTVGCNHHLGQTEIDRPRMLSELARARAKGAPADVTLRP